MLPLVALFACVPATPKTGSGAVEPGDDPTTGGEPLPGEIADTADEGPPDPPPGSDQDLWKCSEIFEQDRLPEYHVTLAHQVWAQLQGEFSAHDGTKGYHPVESFSMDGEEVPDVSIRLKGNEGYSWIGTKMQFVFSFVEINADQRFHGQRHVALDAPWYDPTLLNNRLATRFFRKHDLPAPCTNNAVLYFDDELYGLYAHMEEPDHEYLERNFGKDNADGNLYKYGVELKNNPGADTSRISAWWSDYSPEALVTFGDPNQWVGEWALEATMPDWDGYWIDGHNYFIYDHPENGFMFIPWDLDATFGYSNAPSYDPLGVYWDYVPHERALLRPGQNLPTFVADIAANAETLDPAAIDEDVAAWDAQIRPFLEADPNKYYTLQAHDDAVTVLRGFAYQRQEYLRAWAEANQ